MKKQIVQLVLIGIFLFALPVISSGGVEFLNFLSNSLTTDKIWLGVNGIPTEVATSSLGINLWTLTGSNISYSDGNVGIGTATPAVLFEIRDATPNIRLTDTTNGTWDSGDEIGLIGFYSEDASTPGLKAFIKATHLRDGAGHAESDMGLEFAVTNTTGSIGTAMVIANDGSVGIATSSPSQKLSVEDGNILIDNNFSYMIKTNGDTPAAVLTMDIFNGVTIKAANAVSAIVIENGIPAEVIRINSSGFVGISSSSPFKTFSLVGDSYQKGNSTTTGLVNANRFTGNGEDLTLDSISGATFTTIQDLQNIFHSTGWASGGEMTDAGSGNIDIAAGIGLIRITDEATSTLQNFDWVASSTIPIPIGTTRYFGVEYNSGSPRLVIKASNTWTSTTDFVLGTVTHESDGTLHITDNPHAIGDHASQMILRMQEANGIMRDNITGGLIIGETGTRNITLTAGNLWSKLSLFPITSKDTSSGDNFDSYYRDGSGGFIKQTASTTWDNFHYDNNTGGLTTLGNNKFATHWVYLELDDEISFIYGREQHNSAAEAEAEGVPATLPDRIINHGKLISRLIFKQNAGTLTEVSSVFAITFPETLVTDHGNLGGLIDDDHTQYPLLIGRTGGQTLIGDIDGSGNLILKGDTNDNGNIIMNSAGGNVGIASTSPWGLLSVNPDGISGPSFVIGSSTKTDFIINNDGNVGIGIVSPQELLHVGGGTDASDITATDLLVTRAGPSSLSARDSTNNVETFLFASSVGGIMGTVTNDPLDIKTNNTSAIFIDASQRVGIGDATPTYKLDVTGDARFTLGVDASHFVATSSSATSTFAGGLTVDTSDFVVDPDADRVGIGTTSPVQKIDMAGGNMVIDNNFSYMIRTSADTNKTR